MRRDELGFGVSVLILGDDLRNVSVSNDLQRNQSVLIRHAERPAPHVNPLVVFIQPTLSRCPPFGVLSVELWCDNLGG